jgi:DNA-binding NarL/FixJ family response regulator
MNMKNLKILIADDHKIFRQGIRAILSQQKDFSVSGEAASAEEIFNVLGNQSIDLILLDIDLGRDDGIEIARRIRDEYPAVRILALSMHGEEAYIIKMLENGTSGYILKNSGMEELNTAIRTVAQGKTYLTSEVTETLIQHLHFSEATGTRTDSEIPLSSREREVLKMIAQEYSNSEIAARLFISIRTVDTHRRNLLRKLKLKNTAGLVKFAIQKGLAD